MKLPEIRKGAASNLATPNIRAPLVEAQARIAAMEAFSIPAQKELLAYQEREDQRKLEEATLAVNEADTTFVADRKGVEEFSPMEEDDETFMSILPGLGIDDPDQVVPAHRVYPEWRAKNYRNAVEAAANGISNKRQKEAFMRKHQAQSNINYAEDAVVATGDQIKYNAKQTMVAVDRARLDGNYDLASSIIEESPLSSTAKAAAQNELVTDKQIDYFSESIEIRDVGKMKRDLHKLYVNDPDSTGNLTAAQQKVFGNQLRVAIGQEEDKGSASSAAQLKMAKFRTEIRMKDTLKNKPVDDLANDVDLDLIRDKYPVLWQEAQWTKKHQPTLMQILRSNSYVQRETLNLIEKESTGEIETSFIMSRLESMIEQGERERKQDALAWGRKVGIIGFEEIDFTSEEAAKEGLANRIEAVTVMQERFGTFTGFLTAAEADQFGGRLENASIDNKLSMFGHINDALGEDYAEPFYEQLGEYNISGVAPLAGQIYSWGGVHQATAKKILEGEQLRKTDELTKLVEKENRAEWDSYAVEKFGGMFAGNTRAQSRNINAFKCLMAVNDDKDTNFERLTGGSIEHNGNTVQTPVPGLSERQYVKYINFIPPEYYKQPKMRMYGISPSQAHKWIQNGMLHQVGKGRGESYLENDAGEQVKQMDGVTPFIFNFDPEEFERQQWQKRASENYKKEVKQKQFEDVEIKRQKTEALNKATILSMTKYIQEPMDSESMKLEEE